MDMLEITAASVNEAIDQAARQFEVTPDQIKVTVLEESKGLFGKAKVRVRAEVVAAAAVAAVEEPPAKRGRAARPPRSEAHVEAPAPVEEPPVEEAPKKPSRAKKPAKAEPPVAAEPVGEEEAKGEQRDTDVVASEADAEQMAEIIDRILRAGDLQARAIVTSLNGRYVNIELEGRDVSYLIGRRGEVLNALQYLVNVIGGRRIRQGVRVSLEGDNFRSHREKVLTNLALEIAEQVRDRGEEAVLDALPAFERRVIHKALGEFQGVQTYSEGEEPNRRVVIAPGG